MSKSYAWRPLALLPILKGSVCTETVRLIRAFYHVLVMDGAEVAAALLCDVNQCPVCTCPRSELDQTDVAYPYRDTESVKRAVSAARSEHLDATRIGTRKR